MKFDSQEQASRIQEEFKGEVVHVSGNMFRVKRGIIEFAKAGISSVDGKLVYGNPRWFVNGEGRSEAKGIENSKMDELKHSIRDRGVDHPVRLRVTEDRDGKSFLEVVNGERRLRAIDELCESGIDCMDALSGGSRPAKDVYEWVECRVEHMDDAMALCCALQLNETGEIIGDNANVNVVKVLRESGYDDQEILKATGKSLSWLREMDQLISLDEVCLKHYQSDVINKRVALRLALIKDVEERVSRLEKIKQAAEERHLEKVRQTRQKAEKAMDEANMAELDDFAQSMDDLESEPAGKKKSDKLSKAIKKAEKAEKELEEVSAKKKKATSKDADRAEGSSKPLSHAKISSKLLSPIQKLIKNDGSSEDGDFDVASLMLIQAILEAILSGESDIMDILGEHCAVEQGESEALDSEISAADDDDEDEDENSYVEASDDDDADEEEEEEEEEESEAAADPFAEDQDEMVADLEREFEEELRSIEGY
jgi:hypothetical protein